MEDEDFKIEIEWHTKMWKKQCNKNYVLGLLLGLALGMMVGLIGA